jgi:adenine/guanine phosphoribosyltransferase-like PRPP-binding protein
MDGPRVIRRADFEGLGLLAYIPRSRGVRHWQDGPSQALVFAKMLPTAGAQFAEDMGRLLAEIAPAGCTLVTCPPAGTLRSRRGWYFAEALAKVVARALQLPFAVTLRWAREGRERSACIRYHRGKGRALGRVAECMEPLAGERVLLIDDGWTTGITSILCREALVTAGATGVELRTLFRTELTRERPANEQRRLRRLRKVRAGQGVLFAGAGPAEGRDGEAQGARRGAAKARCG